MSLLLALFAATPVVLWETSYDGPDHREDRASAMVTDSAGNAWLAGYSFVSDSDFQFTVAGFSPAGELLWVDRYGSPLQSEDRAWAIARDSAGAIVATGGTLADTATGWDFLTVKYSPGGERLWLRHLDLGWRGDDKPAALAIAPGDCPVVAGAARRRGSRTDHDIAVVKYSPAGETLWTRRWDGAAARDDQAAALAVSTDAVYVAGKTVTTPPATDIVLLKYRLDGTLVWTRTLDGPAGATDFPAQVEHRAGHIYLGGTVTGTGTAYDWCIAAYDTAGRRLWIHNWDDAGRTDILASFCLDPAGNVVATGQSTGGGTGIDAPVLKLDTAGRRLWVYRCRGAGSSADRGWCVTVSETGAITLAANSAASGGFGELVLLGLSASGDSLWAHRRANPSAGETRPVGLALLGDTGRQHHLPEVLCGGSTHTDSSGSDWFLLRLDPVPPAER